MTRGQARHRLPTWASGLLLAGLLIGLAGCRNPTPNAAPAARSSSEQVVASFVNASTAAGVDFRRRHCGAGRKCYPETMSAGAAFFDYDGDGDLDLYCVQGAPTPGYHGPAPEGNVLFRNEGNGKFSRVPGAAGAACNGYGVGCVAADYDNDGDQDLYVCNYGPNRLYQNQGDGTFRDLTAAAGISGGSAFTSDAAFGDYDRDGHLDLFLANYVLYSWGDEDKMRRPEQLLAYFSPLSFRGCPNVLYHNNGDGTFTDVTRQAGLYSELTRGMDATWFDFNDDGYPDLFVTNDMGPQLLYRNNRNGTFTEMGVEAGVAFNEEGQVVSGMSVDVADYDHDGRLDVLVSNFEGQSTLLFHNEGGGKFTDVSYQSGVGPTGLPHVSFGANFLDFDNDGHPDVYVANGHVMDNPELVTETSRYQQPDQLLRNLGNGRFADVSAQAGPWFSEAHVGRGVAVGDYNEDGYPDLYVAHSNELGALIRNDTPHRNHWIKLKLVGTRSNRDGVGARVTLRASGLTQVDEVTNGAGILAASDMRLIFGLGQATTVDSLEVRWPSGARTLLKGLKADQLLTITESAGPR